MDEAEAPKMAVTRMYCRNEDRGEMICVGVVFPVFEGDPIQYLCECTKCGQLEIFSCPFPMAFPIDEGGYNGEIDL